MPEPRDFHVGRHAGVLVPLFSIPSRSSWGVGEIADLPRFASWLRQAGLDFMQLLPVNEMQEGQSSPYSALTAMAIDPIFLALADVPEFQEAGGERSLDAADRERLDEARARPTVEVRAVRALKSLALHLAFHVFRRGHAGASDRSRDFRRFAEREAWWLADYALFRALHDEHRGAYWRDWEPELRDRSSAALESARQRLSDTILYYQYLQWLADEQWQRARRDCGEVGVFGDFPFMVSGHSADVWARQHEFRLDASVGTPPDAFSETGQDWGLPVYRWDVIAGTGYEWLRQRARRCSELYDGFRVDHLIGFYRTFVREPGDRKYFTPADEPSQTAQGERILRILREAGARIIAEDLGLVPDFVRASLARMNIPGLKVLRWEREWHTARHPFRNPAEYPAESVAISGTHDTETLAEWWDNASAEDRQRCADIPGLRETGCNPDAPFGARTRDALLRALFGAGSNFVIVPFQDLFGWRDRVNVPAVVNDENWTWRLPWPIEELGVLPETKERAGFLRALAGEYGRDSGSV
jgi:4-alpha-glucanotransferase